MGRGGPSTCSHSALAKHKVHMSEVLISVVSGDHKVRHWLGMWRQKKRQSPVEGNGQGGTWGVAERE